MVNEYFVCFSPVSGKSCIHVRLCVWTLHVGDADGTVRLSGRSTDGENEGILEIVFNGRLQYNACINI